MPVSAHKSYLGRTVALTACPAYRNGEDTTVSGLWTVEGFCPTEPSAYVWSPIFELVRDVPGTDEPEWVDVDVDVLIEQIDPQAHARSLVEDREWELAAERMDGVVA